MLSKAENYGSAYGVYSVPGYKVYRQKPEQPKSLLIQGDIKQEIQPTCIRLWEMVPSEDPDYVLYLTNETP